VKRRDGARRERNRARYGGRVTDPGERLNERGFAELRERITEGPVVMLNLLRFTPDGGAERYDEYARAVAPLLERAGGRILSSGLGSEALIGPEGWDAVALVEYPTRGAFLEMISSPEYLEIAHLRTEALIASELHPLDPAQAPIA
jgi:uncharacterized protein (DUF1330 family)